LDDIEKQFGALLKQLPGKSEMDALLTDINQAGLGRGLQFDLFKPAASETVRDFYAELPITIRVPAITTTLVLLREILENFPASLH
jgi:Tfp pilus assembly protein PilO